MKDSIKTAIVGLGVAGWFDVLVCDLKKNKSKVRAKSEVRSFPFIPVHPRM